MKLLRTLLTCGAVAIAVTAFVPAAGADVGVTAGSLDFDPTGAPAIGNFTTVTLNGTPQLTSLTIAPFTIVDSRGSGAGWNVLLTVPNLVNGGSTITASNVAMTAPVVTAAGTSDITGVVGNDSAGGFAAGEKIVSAALTDGMGTYLVSPRILKLTVPVTALTGTYTSAATIAVVTGP